MDVKQNLGKADTMRLSHHPLQGKHYIRVLDIYHTLLHSISYDHFFQGETLSLKLYIQALVMP